MAIPGIGKPINPSTLSDIILYLVNLKTPQITINKETIIVGTIRWPALAKLNAYKNIAGAIPNEMISDNESIFLPKPYSSTLLVLRATKPSAESNNNENIIKIAAR